MATSLRQIDILAIAKSEGRVMVEDLAERFGVASQTIRRDLGELADSGMLNRVHGGAVMPAGVANIGYEERRGLNAGAKAAAAHACAARIPDNSAIFLNIGTSTEAVARALLGHRNITVVTNNMNVANILVANESCEIVVAGGQLRRADGGLLGDLTAQIVEQFKLDYAIIGTSGLDEDGDLLDFDLREVHVTKAIIRHARQVFLVTDAAKLARRAPVRIASLADLDAVFIDDLPPALAAKCRDWGTEVVLAKS